MTKEIRYDDIRRDKKGRPFFLIPEYISPCKHLMLITDRINDSTIQLIFYVSNDIPLES